MTSLVYGGRRFGNLWPGLGEWASSNFGRSRAGKRHQVDGGGAGGALVAKQKTGWELLEKLPGDFRQILRFSWGRHWINMVVQGFNGDFI